MSSLFKVVLLILAMGMLWAIQHRFAPAPPPSQEPILESSILTEYFQRSEAKSQPRAIETAFKLNVNTASGQELESLPRIGPKLAEAIIRFRNDHGDFKTLDQLKEVKGIGEKRFAAISELLTVGERQSSFTDSDE